MQHPQHPEPQETPTFTQICPKAPKPNRNTKKPELHLKSKPKIQIKPQIKKKEEKLQRNYRRHGAELAGKAVGRRGICWKILPKVVVHTKKATIDGALTRQIFFQENEGSSFLFNTS
jgi:hypothetical protein